MNNPGIDPTIWARLKSQWSELKKDGHDLRVDLKLIADPKDQENILAIDVIQNVNGEVFTETVQRRAGEAYTALGISGLSMEGVVEVYKKLLHQLHRQTVQKKDIDLIVTMSPNSETSGEVRGYTQNDDSVMNRNIFVNHQHYYLLNALREKMIEIVGEGWSKVKAVYRAGELEFYFDY